MTVTIIICAILGVAIVTAVLTHFGWSISTQHRDHGVEAGGSLHRRWIWSRRRPPSHAGPVNPDAIPRDSISGQPSNLSAGITEDQG
ncbi:MAG TPA: hypothetical protein VKR21_18220 [Solirubrobacteraceae bacterium]|nr:hypothetical protein [Solirubrobacteraceae bacterium]